MARLFDLRNTPVCAFLHEPYPLWAIAMWSGGGCDFTNWYGYSPHERTGGWSFKLTGETLCCVVEQPPEYHCDV